jgi:IS5 family transposase
MNNQSQTFADQAIMRRIDKFPNHFLLSILELVDWQRLYKIVNQADRRNLHNFGRDSYNPENMIRMFIIQDIYCLSDRDLEFHVSMNSLYSYFCGFSAEDSIPDHSTICRWRERFNELDIFTKVFKDFRNQLLEKGLIVQEGAIIDGTLVKAQAKSKLVELKESEEPKPEEMIVTVQTKESSPAVNSTSSDQQQEKRYRVESKDPDASPNSKKGVCIFGFNINFVSNTDGFVLGATTFTGKTNDCKAFQQSIDAADLPEGEIVYADKGYDAGYNREYLAQQGLRDGIMYKKVKNEDKKIRAAKSFYNKALSRIRYVIERTIGNLKQWRGMAQMIYIGINKVHNYAIRKSFAHNLIRATKLSTG